MVQGEVMERKKSERKKKGSFPAWILFLCGFLLGMLLPNLAWKLKWKQKALASVYLLSSFGTGNVSGTEYLLEIIRLRGGYFLLCILCGFTVFGVPIAVLGMVILGGELGALFAMSLLQFWLAGGAISTGLLFPQYLIYIPVTFMAMDSIYTESMRMWKNHGIFPQNVNRFCIRALAYTALFFAGSLLECYVNPWVVEKILSILKIF